MAKGIRFFDDKMNPLEMFVRGHCRLHQQFGGHAMNARHRLGLAFVLVLFLAGCGNSANVRAAEKPGDEEPAGETFVRTIVDGEGGKPLAGVPVTVEHCIGPTRDPRVIATIHHVTDKHGMYEIKLPAAELELSTLSLRFVIDQPKGYARPPVVNHYMQYLRSMRKLGFRDPYDRFDVEKVYPGVEVTGTIEDPTGNPLAELAVHVTSSRPTGPMQTNPATEKNDPETERTEESGAGSKITGFQPVIMSEGVGQSDAQGRFSCMVLKDSTAWLWVEPAGYAPLFQKIGTKRNLGKIVLTPGVRVSGRVVDAEAHGVPGVWVRFDPAPPPPSDKPMEVFQDSPIRKAQTDRDGRFRSEPVNPGSFFVAVAPTPAQMRSLNTNLPAVFDLTMISLSADEPETTIEIRATPHYTIRAQFTDSAGKPFAGGQLGAFGRRESGGQFTAGAESDQQGLAEVRVPRDLTSVQVETYSDQENVYRFRSAKDDLLRSKTQIKLGRLAGDANDLSFVRYRAAALSILVVDPAGKPIQMPTFKINYLAPNGKFDRERDQPRFFPNTARRWIAMGLAPDQQLLLTVDAAGRQTTTEKLKLAEGETKELKVTLKPQPRQP